MFVARDNRPEQAVLSRHQASRRAEAVDRPHHQTEVGTCQREQVSLGDLVSRADTCSSMPARRAHVCEAPFEDIASPQLISPSLATPTAGSILIRLGAGAQ
jgi:hypothetical protein